MPKPTQPNAPKKSAEATRTTSKPSRTIARPKYKTFRMSKRLRHPRPQIAGSFKLFKRSLQTIHKRKRLFLGIAVAYLVLTVVLVKSFGVGVDIAELKESLTEVSTGSFSGFLTSVALFSVLMSNVNATQGQQASAYQTIFLVMTSLAVIWALRQTLSPNNKKIKLYVRDAFYKGMYPLVPFLLVLGVIGLQLLPLVAAGYMYTNVIGAGLATTGVEKFVWVLLISSVALTSLYMITSSIFALYIVTLPDVRPMQALRSARDLVSYRRWTIMRKLLFLPFAVLALAAMITLPLIILAPTLAEWLFFGLSMFGLVVFHSYLYALYRELL